MLRYDQAYAQCVQCYHVFVVSEFSTHMFCNYDKSSLMRIGKEYPSNAKVGA